MFIVVLAKEDEGPATLTCNSPDTNITWKFEGHPFEDVMSLSTQNGQHLILSKVDYSMFGNYSCWSEGRPLSSVYLLREVEEEGETFLLVFLSFHHCTCHVSSDSFISFINSMITLTILAEDRAFFDCLLIWATLSDLLWFIIYFAVLLWSSQILSYTAGHDPMTVSSTVNGTRKNIQQCESVWVKTGKKME